MAHGADPFLKNQEGQSPFDLASADDVRCLLQDVMASQQGIICNLTNNQVTYYADNLQRCQPPHPDHPPSLYHLILRARQFLPMLPLLKRW